MGWQDTSEKNSACCEKCIVGSLNEKEKKMMIMISDQDVKMINNFLWEIRC